MQKPSVCNLYYNLVLRAVGPYVCREISDLASGAKSRYFNAWQVAVDNDGQHQSSLTCDKGGRVNVDAMRNPPQSRRSNVPDVIYLNV